MELSCDGEAALCFTEATSIDLSGSAVDSLDIPGSRILSPIDGVSRIESSWLRLNAAEPVPRSAVCRNHVGSFSPKDSAISVLDNSSARSGVD